MSLKLTSHVGRDLLASASAFQTADVVVWEYVVNSLQYVDPGVRPRIQVEISPMKKEITIADNGRGMSDKGLNNFFTMHGENFDRKAGRAGRGKFGTGKSAAFGIARQLRVDTRRDGLRNVVELHREAIDRSHGEAVPLEWQVRNEPTEEANSTKITISQVVLKKIDRAAVVQYIEKHLSAFRSIGPEVAVGTHLCACRELTAVQEFAFRPSARQAAVLGDLALMIKVSPSPLSEGDCGVVITTGPGATVAVEDGGVSRKEMGNYLFGEVEAPSLEMSDSPLEPYDPTRRLRLNPQHPVAQVLVAFVASKLDEVRRELVRRHREEQRSLHARNLAKEAERIAQILNGDFQEHRQRLQDIRSASGSRGPSAATFGASASGGSEPEDWVQGSAEPGTVEDPQHARSEGHGEGRPVPEIPRAGKPNANADHAVDPIGGSEGRRKRPSAGFHVEYRNLGQEEADRSCYDATTLTILINLDHPAVSASLDEAGIDGVSFRRLSYEIAFSEYSFAFGYHLLEQDSDMAASETMYEVRQTLNRVAAAAADLYR